MSIPSTIHGMIHSVQRAERSRVSDAELLRRYLQKGEQSALAMIVDRYGSLVRATCLRTTSDTHHADDAFQATFLTLARTARTIRRPEALPAWLVRVARHAALKRRQTTTLATESLDPARSPLDQLSAREFLTIFDEELDRLPANYRSALLLCLVEGQTVEETARHLGTTHGTIRGWLQRGREKLRQRLARRGLDLSAVLPAVALYYTTPASAAVHQSLQSMLNGSAAIPANISALISGTSLTSMLGSLAAIIFLGAILAGASLWAKPEQPPTVIASTPQPPAPMPIETNPARLPQDVIARVGSNSFRHGGEVTALAFSKDNRYLASASPADFENSVRVWDMATGKEKLRVPVESNSREGTIAHRPVAVAFSDDNTQLRVLDWASYRMFDITSGKELVRHDFGVPDMSPHQPFPYTRVIGTAFSPDAQRYATVRGTGELVIGDTVTGLPITTIPKSFTQPERFDLPLANITFSPDSTTICIPLYTNVKLFDVKTGRHLSTYDLDGRFLRKAVLTGSRELTCIITEKGGNNPGLHVVDMTTCKPIHQSEIRAFDTIATSPNGKWLATGNSGSGNLATLLIDQASKKVVHRIPMLLNTTGLAFSPDSQWLAHANYTGAIMIWNVETGAKHPLSSTSEFMIAKFERDGLLAVSNESLIEHYDRNTWREVSQIQRNLITQKVTTTFSSDRRLKAEPQPTGTIVITEVATGKELHRVQHQNPCWRIEFSPDNRRIIGITIRDAIQMWDLESKTELWSYQLRKNSFGTLGTGDPRFSQDWRWMALGCNLPPGTGQGYAIRVFDLQEKKEVASIEAPYFIYGGINISPDGRFVAGGGARQSGKPEADAVFVWEVAAGRLINTLHSHVLGNNGHMNDELHCLFTPDSRKLLTIDGKGTMRLWELSTGQVLWKSAENHGSPQMSISPDGGVIASSSFDAPVLLWDLYGNAKGPSKKAEKIDTEKLWAELAGDDAGKAFSAIRQLCAAPDQAIKLLREKLPATKPRSNDAIAQWIKNLDSAVFTEREQASKELLNILEEVEPRLRQTRAATTSDEVRRRIAALLLKAGKLSPDRLRQERALDVLEHLGTPEAKQHLQTLAKGAANTPLTLAAQAALERMAALKTSP